nr:multidrug ABC transporter permease [Rhodococcus sp. (in: high G+C Gram-positive bacteria)]
MSKVLAGTRTLLRTTLRIDIRNIVPWVLLISALSVSSILAYTWIFPDPQDRIELAATLGSNPALSLIFGPANDLLTADGFNAWRAGQLGAFFAGMMAVLIVVRNSRADEDSGQAELLAAGVLSRGSRLAVPILMASIASLALGIVCFALTVAVGGGALSTLILSATFTASGLMFAGVAAVAAQLAADARTASSLAIAILGISYVLRGYLDTSDLPEWTTWLTPLGWLEQTKPAVDNNPWPLLPALACALVLIVFAFALQNHRDFGQGLIPQRPGPATAGLVGSAWGLALRLHRSAAAMWTVAFVGLGLLFGTLATSIGDIVADNPAMAEILASGATGPADLTFAFIVTILQIVAIIAAVAGVQIALRMYSEEVGYRVEPLLATSLRRPVYFASNALVALLLPAVGLLLAGLCLGVVAAAQGGGTTVGDVVAQSAVTVVATWTLVALALAVVGAAPRLRVLAWLGVVATFGLTIIGPTFKLPASILGVSPLHHIPNVNAPSPNWSGLGWLAVITSALLIVGFVGYRRRDIL